MPVDEVKVGRAEDQQVYRHIGCPPADAASQLCWPLAPYHHGLPTVAEFCSLETCSIARNFDGVAQARPEKPKRQIDVDRDIAEQPLGVEGGAIAADADAQTETMASRADTGLAVFGQDARLARRLDGATLNEIRAFDTADRTHAFVKDLQDKGLMIAGEGEGVCRTLVLRLSAMLPGKSCARC